MMVVVTVVCLGFRRCIASTLIEQPHIPVSFREVRNEAFATIYIILHVLAISAVHRINGTKVIGSELSCQYDDNKNHFYSTAIAKTFSTTFQTSWGWR